MHIVVTGGCGFIGSHVVDLLAEQDCSVTVVDDKRNGTYVSDSPNVSYIFDDVCNVTPPPCDGIIHLANTPRVRASFDHPAESILNNINPTVAVCEWATRFKCPLYFAQSSSVEFTDPYSNAYTFGKAMCEEALNFYSLQYSLDFHLMFFYNVYGPREADYGEHSTVIRAFKNQIIKNESLRIFGTGNKSRDFTHIEDVAKGVVNLVVSGKKIREAHFGSNNPYTINQIAEAFDHPSVYEFDRKGEAEHTICETPYIKRSHDVIEYIRDWKGRFQDAKSGS
jgi:UDP-glucose 4-epimerase